MLIFFSPEMESFMVFLPYVFKWSLIVLGEIRFFYRKASFGSTCLFPPLKNCVTGSSVRSHDLSTPATGIRLSIREARNKCSGGLSAHLWFSHSRRLQCREHWEESLSLTSLLKELFKTGKKYPTMAPGCKSIWMTYYHGDEFAVVTDWIFNYWTNSLPVYAPSFP